MIEAGFAGRRVVTFESRKAIEMASLIERYGGVPIVAPTIREVPLSANAEALAFARRLREDGFDGVVLMTGIGTLALVEEIAPEMDRAAFVASLGRVPHVVVRRPKPAAVLRKFGMRDFEVAREPNTWREVMVALSERAALTGMRIAIQEHGTPSVELHEALTLAGAEVISVTVYRWALPEDTGPLRAALRTIADGGADIFLFTSRAQIEHALSVAAEENVEGQLKDRLRRGVVASIGPVCTEALRAEGIPPDLEPSHPKMGHLVKAAAEGCVAILGAKRGLPSA